MFNSVKYPFLALAFVFLISAAFAVEVTTTPIGGNPDNRKDTVTMQTTVEGIPIEYASKNYAWHNGTATSYLGYFHTTGCFNYMSDYTCVTSQSANCNCKEGVNGTTFQSNLSDKITIDEPSFSYWKSLESVKVNYASTPSEELAIGAIDYGYYPIQAEAKSRISIKKTQADTGKWSAYFSTKKGTAQINVWGTTASPFLVDWPSSEKKQIAVDLKPTGFSDRITFYTIVENEVTAKKSFIGTLGVVEVPKKRSTWESNIEVAITWNRTDTPPRITTTKISPQNRRTTGVVNYYYNVPQEEAEYLYPSFILSDREDDPADCEYAWKMDDASLDVELALLGRLPLSSIQGFSRTQAHSFEVTITCTPELPSIQDPATATISYNLPRIGSVNPVTLASPQSFTATPGNASVTLAWAYANPPVDFYSYDIYRGTTANFVPNGDSGTVGFNHIKEERNVSVKTFIDTTVVNGTTYYYKIKANAGTAGNFRYSAFASASATPVAMATVPTLTMTLAANPISVTTGVASTITPTVGGTATGTAIFSLQSCGTGGTAPTANSLGAFSCTWTTAGTKTVSLTVAKGTLTQTATTTVTVTAVPTTAPVVCNSAGASQSANMLLNPSFESGLANWSTFGTSGAVSAVVADTQGSPGRKVFRIESDGSKTYYAKYQYVILEPGKVYGYGGRISADVESGGCEIDLYLSPSSGSSVARIDTTPLRVSSNADACNGEVVGASFSLPEQFTANTRIMFRVLANGPMKGKCEFRELFLRDNTSGVVEEVVQEIPRVNYTWDWSEIPVNFCRAGNEDYVYCDATQFSISILKTIDWFTSSSAMSSESIFVHEYYLMKDGFSSDFRKDFDAYVRSAFESTEAAVYTNPSNGLWKYFYNPQALGLFVFKLNGQAVPASGISAGKYKVTVTIPSGFRPASPGSNPVVVNLERLEANNELFYQVPFNGMVGTITTGTSIDRIGYGIGPESANSFPTIPVTSGVPFSYGGLVPSVSLVKIKSVSTRNSFEDINPDSEVLRFTKNEDATYSIVFAGSSIPTPLMLAIGKNEATPDDFKVFYRVLNGQAIYSTRAGTLSLLSWNSFGSNPSTCVDFDGQVLKQKFVDFLDARASGNEVSAPEVGSAFKLNWFNSTGTGKIFLDTVAYRTSANADFKLNILAPSGQPVADANFYSRESTAPAKTVALSGTGNALVDAQQKTLNDFIALAKLGYIKVKATPSTVSLVWDENKLMEFISNRASLLAQCSVEGTQVNPILPVPAFLDGYYVATSKARLFGSENATPIVPPTVPAGTSLVDAELVRNPAGAVIGAYVLGSDGKVYGAGSVDAALVQSINAVASNVDLWTAVSAPPIDLEVTSDYRGLYLVRTNGVIHRAGTAPALQNAPFPDFGMGLVDLDLVSNPGAALGYVALYSNGKVNAIGSVSPSTLESHELPIVDYLSGKSAVAIEKIGSCYYSLFSDNSLVRNTVAADAEACPPGGSISGLTGSAIDLKYLNGVGAYVLTTAGKIKEILGAPALEEPSVTMQSGETALDLEFACNANCSDETGCSTNVDCASGRVCNAVTGACIIRPQPTTYHSADTSKNWKIERAELDAVTAFYNAGSYHCASATTYAAGLGNMTMCPPHNSDFVIGTALPGIDWKISTTEISRLQALKSLGAYKLSSGTVDGYTPAIVAPSNFRAVPYDKKVTLSWDYPAVPASFYSYDIYRSTTPDFAPCGGGTCTSNHVVEITNSTTMTYLDMGLTNGGTGLVNGTKYYYKIKANAEGGEPYIYSGFASADATPAAPPTTCGAVMISECSNKVKMVQCIINWQRNNTATISEAITCASVWNSPQRTANEKAQVESFLRCISPYPAEEINLSAFGECVQLLNLPACTGIMGDVDHDGRITCNDTTKILQMYAGSVTLDQCGDVTGDGKVTAGDAQKLWADNSLVCGPPVAPTAPTNLTATSILSTQMTLNWIDNSNNEEIFYIERVQAPTTATTITNCPTTGWVITGALAANITTHIQGSLSPSTKYCFRINAHNVAGGNSGYSMLLARTTAAPTNTGILVVNVKQTGSGTPIQGATVDVYSGSIILKNQGTLLVSNTTDASGVAPFSLAAGNYTLFVSKTGYTTPVADTFTITAGQTTTRNAFLDAESAPTCANSGAACSVTQACCTGLSCISGTCQTLPSNVGTLNITTRKGGTTIGHIPLKIMYYPNNTLKQTISTAINGKISLDNLPGAQRYRVDLDSAAYVYDTGSTTESQRIVTIVAGQAKDLTIYVKNSPVMPVVGTLKIITKEGNEIVGNVSIRVFRRQNNEEASVTSTLADGTISLDNLTAGEYAVELIEPSLSTYEFDMQSNTVAKRSQTVELGKTKELFIHIKKKPVLPTTGSLKVDALKVKVLDGSLRIIDSPDLVNNHDTRSLIANVSLVGTGKAGSTVADSSGRHAYYTFTGLAPGAYTVHVDAGNYKYFTGYADSQVTVVAGAEASVLIKMVRNVQPVTGLKSTGGVSQIILNWVAPSSVEHYLIKRGNKVLEDNVSKTSVSYTDSKVASGGTAYSYDIYAVYDGVASTAARITARTYVIETRITKDVTKSTASASNPIIATAECSNGYCLRQAGGWEKYCKCKTGWLDGRVIDPVPLANRAGCSCTYAKTCDNTNGWYTIFDNCPVITAEAICANDCS